MELSGRAGLAGSGHAWPDQLILARRYPRAEPGPLQRVLGALFVRFVAQASWETSVETGRRGSENGSHWSRSITAL